MLRWKNTINTRPVLTTPLHRAILIKTVEAEIKPAAHAQRFGMQLRARSQRTGKWTAEGARKPGVGEKTPNLREYCATQASVIRRRVCRHLILIAD